MYNNNDISIPTRSFRFFLPHVGTTLLWHPSLRASKNIREYQFEPHSRTWKGNFTRSAMVANIVSNTRNSRARAEIEYRSRLIGWRCRWLGISPSFYWIIIDARYLARRVKELLTQAIELRNAGYFKVNEYFTSFYCKCQY